MDEVGGGEEEMVMDWDEYAGLCRAFKAEPTLENALAVVKSYQDLRGADAKVGPVWNALVEGCEALMWAREAIRDGEEVRCHGVAPNCGCDVLEDVRPVVVSRSVDSEDRVDAFRVMCLCSRCRENLGEVMNELDALMVKDTPALTADDLAELGGAFEGEGKTTEGTETTEEEGVVAGDRLVCPKCGAYGIEVRGGEVIEYRCGSKHDAYGFGQSTICREIEVLKAQRGEMAGALEMLMGRIRTFHIQKCFNFELPMKEAITVLTAYREHTERPKGADEGISAQETKNS